MKSTEVEINELMLTVIHEYSNIKGKKEELVFFDELADVFLKSKMPDVRLQVLLKELIIENIESLQTQLLLFQIENEMLKVSALAMMIKMYEKCLEHLDKK